MACPAPGDQARSSSSRQPGWNTSSRSVQTQISVSGGINSIERFRAVSKRQGEMTSSVTLAPRLRSSWGVPSVEPVSSTTMWSASDMESIQRRANLASFLQMA